MLTTETVIQETTQEETSEYRVNRQIEDVTNNLAVSSVSLDYRVGHRQSSLFARYGLFYAAVFYIDRVAGGYCNNSSYYRPSATFDYGRTPPRPKSCLRHATTGHHPLR